MDRRILGVVVRADRVCCPGRPGAAAAQGPPAESEFEVTTLAKGADKTGEPIAMAFLPDRRVLHTSDPNRGPGGQVEFNLIKSAGNYGWAYCHGRNAARTSPTSSGARGSAR
jgi:hypothetical protein